MRRRVFLAVLATAIAATPPLCHAATYAIGRCAIGNGATSASGTGAGLRATAGQAVIGASAGAGRVLQHGFWSAPGARVLGVGPIASAALPDRPELGAPRPDPARGLVTFDVALPRSARVALEVYDLSGRRVDATPTAAMSAGRHALPWGPNAGERSGVYFVRLVVDARAVASRRLVVAR